MRSNKLGHRAPKGFRVNKFNSIEINGDWAYCKSHNFVYNTETEQAKLYMGLPCYYTDMRFVDTLHNYYHNTMLYWTRWKDISLKSCIRKVMSCKGIPKGTIVKFNKSWYYPKYKIDNGFNFKIKTENPLDIQYEINNPEYSNNFTSCERSQKLVDELRQNGFIVAVTKNESFLLNMVKTASTYTGKSSSDIDSEIEGETAIAYGFNKKIGFSSFADDFSGYSCGCDNILWDWRGQFNKWSDALTIPKQTSIEEIIYILTSTNYIEDDETNEDF